MQGQRIRQDEDSLLPPLKLGEYGRQWGVWYGKAPNGLVANLGSHSVTEHEDGTITVTPSILVSGCDDDGAAVSWHGYLTRGVWSEC